MSWVKWSQWTDTGMVDFGQMPVKKMQENLQRFETEAKKILNKTGAAHVLYGRKLFGEDGELEELRFYLIPMDEAEFDRVAKIPRQQVYALHAMR